MSYHIVSIDEADCSLSVSKGQLIVSGKNGTRMLPMEDIAAIVVTSYKCMFSNHFFVEAAKRRVGVVLCDVFQPSAVVLPANRATDTEIIRNLSKLSAQSKLRLWGKTLEAKCLNQYVLAKKMVPEPSCTVLNVEFGKINQRDPRVRGRKEVLERFFRELL